MKITINLTPEALVQLKQMVPCKEVLTTIGRGGPYGDCDVASTTEITSVGWHSDAMVKAIQELVFQLNQHCLPDYSI